MRFTLRGARNEEKPTIAVALIALWVSVIGTVLMLARFAGWAAAWTLELRRALGYP